MKSSLKHVWSSSGELLVMYKTRSQMGPDRLSDGPSTVTLATPDNC
jgi:hypothetical protein